MPYVSGAARVRLNHEKTGKKCLLPARSQDRVETLTIGHLEGCFKQPIGDDQGVWHLRLRSFHARTCCPCLAVAAANSQVGFPRL